MSGGVLENSSSGLTCQEAAPSGCRSLLLLLIAARFRCLSVVRTTSHLSASHGLMITLKSLEGPGPTLMHVSALLP